MNLLNNVLKLENGLIVQDSTKILHELGNFYQSLYGTDNENDTKHTFFPKMPSLTTYDQSKCDGDLTESECLKSLKTMKLNKSPGPDGLTTEFYLEFWPEIGPKLVRMLNYAKTQGELPISQRRAIITLLHKQGKERIIDEKLETNLATLC